MPVLEWLFSILINNTDLTNPMIDWDVRGKARNPYQYDDAP
jgi:hypothetical protein